MQFSIQIRFQEALAVGFVDGGEHHDGAGVDAVDDPPGVEDLHLGADTHQHLVGLAGVGAPDVCQGRAAADLFHDVVGDLLGLVADHQQHAPGAGTVHELVDDGGGNEGHQHAVEDRVDIAEDVAAGEDHRPVHGDGDRPDGQMGLELADAHDDEVRAAGGGAGHIDGRKAHAGQGARKEGGQQGVGGRVGIAAQQRDHDVQEEGRDQHALDGLEEEHPAQQTVADQGHGNIDDQRHQADAEGRYVMMHDHGDTGDAARREVRVGRKIGDTQGVEEAAQQIVGQVVADQLPAVFAVVAEDALLLFRNDSRFFLLHRFHLTSTHNSGMKPESQEEISQNLTKQQQNTGDGSVCSSTRRTVPCDRGLICPGGRPACRRCRPG